MIEVEKRFQPTEEQIKALLEGAEFIKDIVIHDIYYDYPDIRLMKSKTRLRDRNGSFELKIGKGSGMAEEIEDEAKIVEYFSVSNLRDFVNENLIPVIDSVNNRTVYSKEGFEISFDDMDWGYKMCEIELVAEDEKEALEVESKILSFAERFGLEVMPTGKRDEYLKRFKPEIYKELYGDK
jgi:predicted adenylyl cyclase CyaB